MGNLDPIIERFPPPLLHTGGHNDPKKKDTANVDVVANPMIVVPVCKRHGRPGPFLCGFCITDDLICNEVTCDACLKEREDLYDHIG